MTKKAVPAIQREILTYLGSLPRQLQIGSASPQDLALHLGNCLIWIASEIDGSGPHAEQAIHENAQTVFALGKQFRAVALELIDRTNSALAESGADYLESRVYDLEKLVNARLCALENILNAHVTRTVAHNPGKDAAFEQPLKGGAL